MLACNVQSCVVQCCGLVSVFCVVKWVTWHCTLPLMPASKQKKISFSPDTRRGDSTTCGLACASSFRASVASTCFLGVEVSVGHPDWLGARPIWNLIGLSLTCVNFLHFSCFPPGFWFLLLLVVVFSRGWPRGVGRRGLSPPLRRNNHACKQI